VDHYRRDQGDPHRQRPLAHRGANALGVARSAERLGVAVGLRGRPCKICLSPELRVRVEATRETGASYREIAALVGFDKFKIARHFKHSAPAQPVAETENLDELKVSDQRLATLLARLEAQYSAAVSVGDNKVALDITKVSARLEAEKHNRLVARKQAELDSSDKVNPNTPEKIDGLLKIYEQKKVEREKREQDLVARGFVHCPLCSVAESAGNWIFPGAIQKRWAECQKVYDIWCDAQSKKMEEQHAASAVQ